MPIKIVATAFGFAAILGAGAILLSLIGNSAWLVFLLVGFIAFVIGEMIG